MDRASSISARFSGRARASDRCRGLRRRSGLGQVVGVEVFAVEDVDFADAVVTVEEDGFHGDEVDDLEVFLRTDFLLIATGLRPSLSRASQTRSGLPTRSILLMKANSTR